MERKESHLISEEGTPFNMAMLYYLQINKAMDNFSVAIVSGDLDIAYEWLNEMFSKASVKFKPDERKSFEKRIKSLSNRLYMLSKSSSSEHQVRSIRDDMRTIDRDLKGYMLKYKMLFPDIQIKDGFKKIRDSYGIV